MMASGGVDATLAEYWPFLGRVLGCPNTSSAGIERPSKLARTAYLQDR